MLASPVIDRANDRAKDLVHSGIQVLAEAWDLLLRGHRTITRYPDFARSSHSVLDPLRGRHGH